MSLMLTIPIVLCVTAGAVRGETRVFKIIPHGGWKMGVPFDGFYIEADDRNHFKRVGPSVWGSHNYIWRAGSKWNLGMEHAGTKFNPEKATAVWFAEGNDNPPNSGWKWHNENENPWEVEQIPSLLTTMTETETARGSLNVEGGALCEDQDGVWIQLAKSEMWCKEHLCNNRMDDVACLKENMNLTNRIILNGIEPNNTGVYSLQHWHNVKFYKKEGANRVIYQTAEQGLIIGSGEGENLLKATAIYKKRIGENTWKSVIDADGTLTGRQSGGSIEPKVRLTLIPNTIPTELLEDATTFSKETIIEEGVLCFSAATGERIFIARDNMTEGWCDRTPRCKKRGFCFSIKSNFTADMSSAQVTRQGATLWPKQRSTHRSTAQLLRWPSGALSS